MTCPDCGEHAAHDVATRTYTCEFCDWTTTEELLNKPTVWQWLKEVMRIDKEEADLPPTAHRAEQVHDWIYDEFKGTTNDPRLAQPNDKPLGHITTQAFQVDWGTAEIAAQTKAIFNPYE